MFLKIRQCFRPGHKAGCFENTSPEWFQENRAELRPWPEAGGWQGIKGVVGEDAPRRGTFLVDLWPVRALKWPEANLITHIDLWKWHEHLTLIVLKPCWSSQVLSCPGMISSWALMVVGKILSRWDPLRTLRGARASWQYSQEPTQVNLVCNQWSWLKRHTRSVPWDLASWSSQSDALSHWTNQIWGFSSNILGTPRNQLQKSRYIKTIRSK